jgi:hypothetical protein
MVQPKTQIILFQMEINSRKREKAKSILYNMLIKVLIIVYPPAVVFTLINSWV